MPTHLKLLDSGDGTKNLSDEAYAAYKEAATEVPTSIFSGRAKVELDVIAADRSESARLRLARKKRPTNVTVKEWLDETQVREMLRDRAEWTLAVTDDDILSKSDLEDAWDENATGTVTRALRRPTRTEKSILAAADDALTPKAGAARVTGALGGPVANIALLAATAGSLFGLDDQQADRGWLIVAVVCAAAAVVLSLAATNLLRSSEIQLSRLDLLRSRPGPPVWVSNACTVLFLLGFIAGLIAFFPAKGSGSPAASFGSPTQTDAGKRTKIEFTVKWKNLDDDAAQVVTLVKPSTGAAKTTTTPVTADDHSASQSLSAIVKKPATVQVTTHAQKDRSTPVGDTVTHAYQVK